MWCTTLMGCLRGRVANNQEGRLSRRSVPLRHRKRCASNRPRLEGLEDRTVPSGSYVFTTIDDPNGTVFSQANGINSRGDIVGVSDARGFLLSHGQYTTLDDPNGVNGTIPQGINSRGDIVGVFIDANSNVHGFLLSGGQYTTLDVPNAVYTSPIGINARGQIAGNYFDANFNSHGFVLSDGQYTTIDDPNGVSIAGGSAATGINSRGDIVGAFGDADFNVHGFLLSAGQYTTFDVPNGMDTTPFGINDHGQIVGEYFGANFNSHGFLLSGGQYTTIDDPNTAGSFPETFLGGISDSGKIVGGYFNTTNGFGHAFLATPSPNSSVASAASQGGQLGNAGVMDPTLPLNTASLAHARLLRIQVNIKAGGFGGVSGQGLSRTVSGPSTIIVTVPTRNSDATGLNSNGGGTSILFTAPTQSKDFNAIEYHVFNRNDDPLDPGLFAL
jgi:probable HAF family extracellular repeat protein